MNLTEITRDEAKELMAKDPNKLWVMRMLTHGPVDLLPVMWTESHSDVFTAEWFFRNRFTRYFEADVDAVEDFAPAQRELKEVVQKNEDYKNLDWKERMEQLSLF